MENWLREHEHGIKAIAAAAAALFALMQYFDHLKEARVEQTLEFYKRFSSEPIFSSRKSILKSWESLWPRIEQLPKPNSPEEIIALRTQWKKLVVSTVINDVELAANTDAMFDFLGALQVCIENNICDKNSAHELLQGGAKDFFENNCSYVAYMRYDRKSKNFGTKVETLASSQCKVEVFKDLLPNTSL